MGMITRLFKWLLVKAKCEFIHSDVAENFTPFRIMETRIDECRSLTFSVMKDRRKRPLLTFSKTFLVKAEIHHDLPDRLKEYNDIQLLAIDIFFSYFFSDEVVSDVLLNNYLDKMINDLKK